MAGIIKKMHTMDLCKEYSPTMPEGFPTSKIPENICEGEMLTMMRCMMLWGAEYCPKRILVFSQCARNRVHPIMPFLNSLEQCFV
jgi:hypothetical protein